MHFQRIQHHQASQNRSPDSSIQINSENVPENTNTESLNAKDALVALSESAGGNNNSIPNAQTEFNLPTTSDEVKALAPNNRYKQRLIKEVLKKSMPLAAKLTEIGNILQQPDLTPEEEQQVVRNHLQQVLKNRQAKRPRNNNGNVSLSQSVSSPNHSQEARRRAPGPARARTQPSPIYESPPRAPAPRFRVADLPDLDLSSSQSSSPDESLPATSNRNNNGRKTRSADRDTATGDYGHTNMGAPSRPTIPYVAPSSGNNARYIRTSKEIHGA